MHAPLARWLPNKSRILDGEFENCRFRSIAKPTQERTENFRQRRLKGAGFPVLGTRRAPPHGTLFASVRKTYGFTEHTGHPEFASSLFLVRRHSAKATPIARNGVNQMNSAE